MTELTPSTLCKACHSIFEQNAAIPSATGELSHHNLETLAALAANCQLCLTVFTSIDPQVYRDYRNKSAAVDSVGYASISPTARDQARLKFRYVRRAKVLWDENKENRGPRPSSNGSKSSLLSQWKETTGLVVELILVNPKYAVESGLRTVDPQSVTTASAGSLDLAKQWIQDCTFNHMKCSVSTSVDAAWKPTHLLDVSIKGPKGAPGLKLVDGDFVDPLSEYVTLSHCWGKSKAVRLHKGTLAALRQGVSLSSLPRTFAEAAIVAKKLGFRYLWIDALCMRHDSEADVLREISQQYKIYSEAALNIAATSSRDDASGLIYSRDLLALQPCIVFVSPSLGIDEGMYQILGSTCWHDLVDSSPLSKRAWAFQERCLAKRTLHFTRNELFWECQQMCCSEVFPKGLPATMGPPSSQEHEEFFSKKIHHQRHANWHQLVKVYSPKRLTYSSDKLLAITGLAKQYMARNRLHASDYLAGLWKPQLPHALLWRVEKGRRPKRYRAPTWAWASIDGEVTYPEPASSARESCTEIIDIDMKYRASGRTSGSAEDSFGIVQSGKIKVRGFVARGLLRRTQDYWGQTPCVVHCTEAQLELKSASFDDRLPKLSDASSSSMLCEMLEIYLLPVLDVVDRVEGLILCATMKKGEFRRIGSFGMSQHDQTNWNGFRAVMKGGAAMGNYLERSDHADGDRFASDFTYTVSIV